MKDTGDDLDKIIDEFERKVANRSQLAVALISALVFMCLPFLFIFYLYKMFA